MGEIGCLGDGNRSKDFVLRSISGHKLEGLLRLNRVATDQGGQVRLGGFVVLIFITVAFVVLVITSVHQVNDQDCAFAHGIQLEASFQDIISIEYAC
jgi:hypothetical protein